jgi:hypothetical protein
MKNVLAVLTALALTALILLLILGISLVYAIKPKLVNTIENTNRAVIAAGAAAGNVEKASRAWQSASEREIQNSNQLLATMNASAKSLDGLIRATDKNLNEELLPSISEAIQHQDLELTNSQAQLRGNLIAMQKATVRLESTLTDADQILADPTIKVSLDNIEMTSHNVSAGTAELAATATDVRQVADKFRETYLKPVNIWWATLEKILGIGPPIVTAIK